MASILRLIFCASEISARIKLDGERKSGRLNFMNDKNTTSHGLPFDLTDPDGLLFDEEPQLFVHLDASPIVFTVRGLRYFEPRFRMVGFDLASIISAEEFAAAHRTWLSLECSLLGEKIERAAAQERSPGEYSILQAIWHGGIDEAERLCKRMDRRQATALRIVAGCTREESSLKR